MPRRLAVAGDIGRGVEISGVAKVGGVLGGRPRRQVALRAETADKLCPICGSELDPDRVIAQATAGLGGHAHG